MVFTGSIGAKGVIDRMFYPNFPRHKITKKLRILRNVVLDCKKKYPYPLNR
jgi:hypothetical protein